ncbi:hypothetical protein [Medusavirus stheno T3]|uniref:Uncharacterized protein n=1 Tax=Medusavirus stheno T3 TaxID=3069717 RepID=A0A7S8BD38_9VIRU|nr:hypothetical protein QKU73_gp336 [Acanthamoeba castellanii medusavirus]QPB44439.1 hypothetical protein [Medusavirus stheno T3]
MSFFDPRTIVWSESSHLVVDEVAVCVRKPASYDAMPSFERPYWLRLLTEQEERDYWEGVCYGVTRVACLNGVINRGEEDVGSVLCHHCRYPCDNEAYWLCPRCSKDMCGACFEEPAGRETVEECRAHGMLSISSSSRLRYFCDVCECRIYDKTWRHHSNPPYDSIDICCNCEPTEAMKDLIFDDNFSDPDAGSMTRFDATGFGSMLDWVPAGRDAEGDMVLVCLNPDSPNCGHVAIMHADDRERRGYFDLGIDLETFLAETEERLGQAEERADDFVKLWMEVKHLAPDYF